MSDLPRTFVINRTTGTFGDALAAAGLAKVLENGCPVRIEGSPTGFKVTAGGSEPIVYYGDAGYSWFRPNQNAAVPKGAITPFDYKAEKAKSDLVRKLRKGLSSKDPTTREQIHSQIQENGPRSDFPLFQVLNLMQGDETTNRVQTAILNLKPADFRAQVGEALEALAQYRQSSVNWPATSVQLFTPNAAKGYCRIKSDSTDRNDKTKDQWIDPFIEWLRYLGYFAIACPLVLGKDIRMLCPIPHDISIASLAKVVAELRRVPLFGSKAKVDSIAVLKVAEILLTHSPEYADATVDPYDDLVLEEKELSDLISGIAITHYQSLGNARAVSSMSVLAIPGWFRLRRNTGDASVMKEILGEHLRILRMLNDDHSDEMALLIGYRRFLQARGEPALTRLLEFVGSYGSMLLGAWQEGRRLPAFKPELLGRMVMALSPNNLREVLENQGFVAIADAIRRCTVGAQALKSMKRDYREIRYDLLPEIRRKSSLAGPEPLVAAISDFVSKYNSENSRRRELAAGRGIQGAELSKVAPGNITTDQFRAFVSLFDNDKHDAATVGSMLAAFGSCRAVGLGVSDTDDDNNDSGGKE